MTSRKPVTEIELGDYTSFLICGVHRDMGRSIKFYFESLELCHVFMTPDEFRKVGQSMIDIADKDGSSEIANVWKKFETVPRGWSLFLRKDNEIFREFIDLDDSSQWWVSQFTHWTPLPLPLGKTK